MSGIPYIPSSAPFTAEQRAWLNGYLAGLFTDANLGEPCPTPQPAPPEPSEPLLVLFGSQSGTAEGLARKFAKEAEMRGFAPRVMELNAAAKLDLTQEPRAIIITSTWGDGDPPDNATAFWSHLSAETAPKLDNLSYSVLALGDKNYAEFCGAGKKFDERLEKLGAKRIYARVDCDIDYESPARSWMEGVWPALKSVASSPLSVAGTSAGSSVSINGHSGTDHGPLSREELLPNQPFSRTPDYQPQAQRPRIRQRYAAFRDRSRRFRPRLRSRRRARRNAAELSGARGRNHSRARLRR